jgi:hypothetical protein
MKNIIYHLNSSFMCIFLLYILQEALQKQRDRELEANALPSLESSRTDL